MKKLNINLSNIFLNYPIWIVPFSILIFILSINQAFAQKSPWISAEVKVNSIYYLNTESNPVFNYGTSVLLAENFGRSKISFGFEYSTCNMEYNYVSDGINQLYKRDFNTVYFNFPLLYTYKFKVSNKIDLGVLAGISFSIPYKSKVVSYYDNGGSKEDDLKKLKSSTKRINLKTGVKLYYHLSRRINVFCNLYSDLNLNGDEDNPHQTTAPSSSAVGFGIGLEYNWR